MTMYTSENKPQEPASVLPRGGAVKNARKRGPMPAPLAANTPWGVVLKPVTRSGGSALSTEEADRTLEAGPGLEMSLLGPDLDLKMANKKAASVKRPTFGKSNFKKESQVSLFGKKVIFCKICSDLISFLNRSILWYYFLL